MDKHRVFSFTAVKQFEKCPRQYKEVRIDKRYPYEQSDEARWGEYIHSCLENAITVGEKLPDNAAQYQPLVDAVNQRRLSGWEIWCEKTFAITNNGQAEFTDAEDTWWSPKYRLAGNIDLLMVSPDGKEAIINDWKTNKSAKYAEPQQIDLYALGTLLAVPTLEKVTGCLMFICDEYKMVKSTYTRADIPRLWDEWKFKTQRVMLAIMNNHFPEGAATPLCGWCPCADCPNWQQGQDFRERRKKRR